MAKLILILVILCLSYICDAYKILVVFPLPGKSHSILGDGYVRHLLDAGHEVTYITPFPKKNPPPKLNQIDVSENMKYLPADLGSIKSIMAGQIDIKDNSFIFQFFTSIAGKTFENINVQKLINDPTQKFDVIIAEWMFSELYAGFASIFECPYIWSSSVDPHWMVLQLVDETSNPAYVPDLQSSNVPPFTFKQRVEELWTQISTTFIRATKFNSFEKENFLKAVVPVLNKKGIQAPSYDFIIHNASLLIANSHVSLGLAMSLPQNCILVGGYHIEEKVAPLPQDLKKIMDESEHGVIYFSMGSNLKSSGLPDELKQSFLRIFGELKQTVIWKFEEDLANKPKNVHIVNWAPQQSILAHPKSILFITHGGYLSTTETVHFGVPIIGIPVFADQFINVERAVEKGFAKKVDLRYDMAHKLKTAIDDILSNPSYAEKVKDLSQIYHDRPVSPGKELVHWVEHVVKTRGAPHLRSPALMLPWYQKLYLDLAVIILIGLIILKTLLKKIFSLCKTSEKKTKKKRN